MPRAPRGGDWAALLALTLLWGSAFLLNELALASISPALIVAGRISIAALLVVAAMLASGTRLPAAGRAWWPMIVLAILGNALPFHLIAWAQQHIDSSLAGVLMAVMPLFVLTLAHFFVPGARLTAYRIVGFMAGFAGVVVVIGPNAVQGFGSNMVLWGILATLGAALSYAISSIYARRLSATDPLRLSAGMLLVASAMSLPAAAVDLPGIETPSLVALGALLVLGSLSTGLATLLYFRIVQGPGPTFLSFVNYLVPVWAVLAGALFLNESLSSAVFAGLALILSGIALSELGSQLVATLKIGAGRALPSHRMRLTREEL